MQQERRPPRQGMWLVHECIFVENAFALTFWLAKIPAEQKLLPGAKPLRTEVRPNLSEDVRPHVAVLKERP